MLETPRLIIRPFQDHDIEPIYEMRRDPEVMRYIREPQTRIEETYNWITMITALWEDSGIGFLGVEEKSTGDFVGWCGLWILKETSEIEVGYALRKESWGLGYATEAARRVLEYGFDDLSLERIVAVAVPGNDASVNIMKKLGMEYVGIGRFYDKDLVQYALLGEKFLRETEN